METLFSTEIEHCLLKEVTIFCSNSNVRNFLLFQSIGPHTYFGSPWYEFGNLQVRSRVILQTAYGCSFGFAKHLSNDSSRNYFFFVF